MKIFKSQTKYDLDLIKRDIEIIKQTYNSFGVVAETRKLYFIDDGVSLELIPAIGTKVNKVINHKSEIALAIGIPKSELKFEVSPNNMPMILLTIKKLDYLKGVDKFCQIPLLLRRLLYKFGRFLTRFSGLNLGK